ncbi:hypothetical protein Fmac_015317 [Flemingia macrophylla]|uniref:Uncharacterized protein n=1 Tax=Flemingia macrophylla TaxID=520843 RepID=A0ABD1MEA1_9FABA
MAPDSLQFGARNDAIVIRGVHDVATDTSAKTRKLAGKLDALVNLKAGRQARCLCELGDSLIVNHKPAFIARVCGIRSSNEHHTSVCPSSQQLESMTSRGLCFANTYSRPPQAERDKALDREDGSQPLAVQV